MLEITESAVMGDVPQMAEVLEALKSAGAKLSIDDFGTGYSSLSYLRQFPFDELKIDKSFVDGLDSEPARDRELTETIMQIAKTLKLETVAEGIERPGQVEYLKKLRCDRAQGSLLSVPLRQDQLAALLESRETSLAA